MAASGLNESDIDDCVSKNYMKWKNFDNVQEYIDDYNKNNITMSNRAANVVSRTIANLNQLSAEPRSGVKDFGAIQK